MGNFFSKLFQRKGIVMPIFEEYSKLVEVLSSITGNAVEVFSQKISGLTILNRKEDRGDSSSVLNKKVEDGKMVTFECTPLRYAAVSVKKETPMYKGKPMDLFQWKGIVRLAFEEHKKLVEVHSTIKGNAVGKVIHERFSHETSGLTILTRKEDRGDSSSVLNKKVADGKTVTFECTYPRYAAVSVKKETSLYKGKPKDDLEELFHPLKIEEVEEVSHALYGGNSNEILITHESSNIEISRNVLQCLKPSGWLNDEVINLYLELLKERERREPKKFLKCHFFNTFFYKKLINGKNGYDFRAVRKWTTKKKLGYTLIECDKVFVPIHKDVHWCLAVINIKDETFHYLDSLCGIDAHVLEVLARYLMEETRDKTDKEIDTTSWKKEPVNDLPLQKNGFDCGMFMIKYADFYSRGLRLCFSQKHMDYFRKKTAKEILRLRAE